MFGHPEDCFHYGCPFIISKIIEGKRKTQMNDPTQPPEEEDDVNIDDFDDDDEDDEESDEESDDEDSEDSDEETQ